MGQYNARSCHNLRHERASASRSRLSYFCRVLVGRHTAKYDGQRLPHGVSSPGMHVIVLSCADCQAHGELATLPRPGFGHTAKPNGHRPAVRSGTPLYGTWQTLALPCAYSLPCAYLVNTRQRCVHMANGRSLVVIYVVWLGPTCKVNRIDWP